MTKSKSGWKKSDFTQTDKLAEKMNSGEVKNMADEDREVFMDDFSKTLLGELGAALSKSAKKKTTKKK